MTANQEARLSTGLTRLTVSLVIAMLAWFLREAKSDVKDLQAQVANHQTEIELLKQDIGYIKAGITEIRIAVHK
jgi:cell division protein FtsB